jgi:DNA-binding HxlR family transcriptional regulator
MANRSYGQFCGLARALELVGERWALLVIRDLLVGPRRFTDLHRGLPRIPTNVLSTRLKELEQAGIIRRRVLPRPESGVVYELTEYGSELEDVVLRMGRWGAQSLGELRPDEIVTADSMIMALRAIFRPEAAAGVHLGYELRLGEVVFHARVDDDELVVGEGALPGADLVIESGPGIKALMAGELTPAQALANGSIRLQGPRKHLVTFSELFQIPRGAAAVPA